MCAVNHIWPLLCCHRWPPRCWIQWELCSHTYWPCHPTSTAAFPDECSHDFIPWSSFRDACFSSILKSPALLQPVPGEFYPWQQFHPLTCMLQLHATGSITSMMFNMMPLPYHCFPQPSSLLTALLLALLRIPQRPLFLCFPLTSDIL